VIALRSGCRLTRRGQRGGTVVDQLTEQVDTTKSSGDLDVDDRASLNQQQSHRFAAVGGRIAKRRGFEPPLGLDIGSPIQEQPRHLNSVRLRGEMQGRPTMLRSAVDVGTGIQERPYPFQPPLVGGMVNGIPSTPQRPLATLCGSAQP